MERILLLAIGMRLTDRERDRLMAVRLRKMGSMDPGMTAAVAWALDAGKRAASARHKLTLTDDEAFVLAAYRVAAEAWPLGINQTEQVAVSLVAHMEAQLERSAKALQEDLETDTEPAVDPVALAAKIVSVMQKLAESPKARDAWLAATKQASRKI